MVLLFNHPPSSIFLGVIKFLTWLKVNLVFTILNVMCEGVSAALEQVAGNRLAYISGGCVVVAIGFAVGELLWMKKMKLHIDILDLLGFLATLSQVLSSGLQLVFACLHKSSPINFSVFSLIFALLSAYYKIIWKSRTHKLPRTRPKLLGQKKIQCVDPTKIC
ncbi:hypothetical protein RHGRI_000335 [Rhododendron griersonianum]|uniref:Uncharacterized protein n=1 Tax=Rhododendron griersonianum TaxID=479676 RepID=A0AAV6LG92_9ERIC|nr:hypothetical protein RHGRI_000335 [Rhododendron griersonianum]